MTDTVSIGLSGTLNVKHLRRGQHTLLIPVPDDIVSRVGKIVVAWGGFELRMDKLLESLLQHHHNPPEGWQRRAFAKRKELFRDEIVAYTEKYAPGETEAFKQLCATAGDLYWRRNVVVHGYYEPVPLPEKNPNGFLDAGWVATGNVKGQKRQISLDPETLDKLWHDLGHLGGGLMHRFHRLGGQMHSAIPDLVVSDTDLLQKSPVGSFQTLPIHKATRRPRGSSRE